ncbi:MAG: hypothetical protein JWN93_2932 [Hyphomicrobiales bacterium]|nr:hypothetical protein [Hyphomicrobiales bacterium]
MSRASASRRLGALLLAAALPTFAFADEPTAPKMPKPRAQPVSAPAFGAQNPSCLEWTDSCRVCVRDKGEIQCSTPGPACLPQALVCKRTH